MKYFLTASLTGLCLTLALAYADDVSQLPIADVHVHYSHDSVDLTPPSRVIELMNSANLKFALVSSSDDNGTQLLSELAPDLIIPGLRPYRRRGELGSWFTDPDALAYVERLLSENRYATIGEFHLYGETADLPIPRRVVELADEYNLVLHAHSDAEAVTRLLAQSDSVKVIWAHSGFDDPAEIAELLRTDDRLYADLAFRGEVSGGRPMSDDWKALFTEFPDRMMLGTDTYTPERMYFIPEHANGARSWLAELPFELAERVAWKNAYELLMPIWKSNRRADASSSLCEASANNTSTGYADNAESSWMTGERFRVKVEATSNITVSQPFSAIVHACGDFVAEAPVLDIDMSMPVHGHGMNYDPEISLVSVDANEAAFKVDGLVLHMPGAWEWNVTVGDAEHRESFTQSLQLQ